MPPTGINWQKLINEWVFAIYGFLSLQQLASNTTTSQSIYIFLMKKYNNVSNKFILLMVKPANNVTVACRRSFPKWNDATCFIYIGLLIFQKAAIGNQKLHIN